jgi:uncharacterized protein (TIGR02594 family)
MNKYVKELQQFLNANGAALVEDGIFGQKTTKAVEALDVPIWVKIALKEVGTLEIAGDGSNPRIEQYHRVAGLPWAKDQIPWCGSALAFIMQKAMGVVLSNSARALSWNRYGINIYRPVLGAIAIKTRKGGGHVGIVLAVSGNDLLLLGGNQADAYTIRKYRIIDFDWFRYPSGQPFQNTQLAFVDFAKNTQEA